MNKKILENIRDLNEEMVLVTIVDTKGSAPRHSGSKMLVTRNGIIEGTVGGGSGEYESMLEAKKILESKKNTVMDITRLGDDPKDSFMICGGINKLMLQYLDDKTKAVFIETLDLNNKGHSVKLRTELTSGEISIVDIKENESDGYFYDIIAPMNNLLILGGGYVGYAIYEIAEILGFEVTVFDDRPEFATKDRFPKAICLESGDFSSLIDKYNFNCHTYVTVVTRGHLQDGECVKSVIRKEHKYIGLIGSKRKISLILDDLKESGYSQEEIDRIHAPIGLDIGAETPEEIAISIMAEIIGVKYGKKIKKDK
jgi:xanthine dehydrogenase accessory factor